MKGTLSAIPSSFILPYALPHGRASASKSSLRRTGAHAKLRYVMSSAQGREASRAAALPLVAIVGRPNVGKSTLFNRLVGERRSIVGDEPGITRDRIYGESEWMNRRFSLVDTGGIVPDDEETIPAHIFRQAEIGRAHV